MSKRTKFLLGIGVIAALVLGLQIAAYAGAVGTAQGFEDDDGNLAPNGGTPNFDWNSFDPVTWSPHPATAPTRQTVDQVTGGFQFKGIEDYPDPGATSGTTDDTSFNGGVKQDNTCAGVGTGKPPNKDDLTRVYLASKVINGSTFLDLAWARIPQNSTSASAHVGFEFNKGTTACPAGSDGLVQRTVGDMLIVYDFEGGSGPPVLTLRRWLTNPNDPAQSTFFTNAAKPCDVDSNSPPCWGDAKDLTASGFAEGRVNTANVIDALSPPDLASTTGTSVDRTLATQEFGEAGINLTAAGVIPANSCEGFGKAYAVSRSSGQSSNAQMKDLVGPANFNLQNCGSIKIIKQTNPRGLNQNFEFTSNIAGTALSCTSDTTPAGFTLNDNGNTGKTQGSTDPAQNSTGNTETCTGVPAGTYTVTEGDNPTGFTLTDITCTTGGTDTDRTATITIAAGSNVTCVFTNSQNKQSTLNTAQGFIPQDTATITGTGLTFTGTVDFKLRKGTLSDPADCGTANDTNPVVFSQDNVSVTQTTPHTASTSNSGNPSVNNGYTILAADAGSFYWEVTYDGPTGGDPDVTSCTEVSTVTINNGSGVSNPPATP